jgi:hypothetical protein
MKLKIFVKTIFVVIMFLVISNICQSRDKELSYMRDGVSFSIADGWKIIANDSIGNNAYYFSAERTGTKATGLITITWVNKVENPLETITLHQRSMKTAKIYKKSGIEFSFATSDNFAGQKVQSCHYVTLVNDQKIEGTIYCFNSFQKTITVFFQSGLTDKKLNQKAFALFQQTFNCRD